MGETKVREESWEAVSGRERAVQKGEGCCTAVEDGMRTLASESDRPVCTFWLCSLAWQLWASCFISPSPKVPIKGVNHIFLTGELQEIIQTINVYQFSAQWKIVAMRVMVKGMLTIWWWGWWRAKVRIIKRWRSSPGSREWESRLWRMKREKENMRNVFLNAGGPNWSFASSSLQRVPSLYPSHGHVPSLDKYLQFTYWLVGSGPHSSCLWPFPPSSFPFRRYRITSCTCVF